MEYSRISWENFSPAPFRKIPSDKRGNYVCEDFITLDTETSHNHDDNNPICWIYQWAITYQGQVVFGRKPSELINVLSKIEKVNKLGLQKGSVNRHSIICFVHNFSYDYEYIKNWLCMSFSTPDDPPKMIAVAAHKILSFTIGGFQFRCTYRLSGKSLDTWSKELNTLHKKLVGNVDYNKIRYQDSPLTKEDDDYMANDVIVLDESIRKQMEIYDDDLTSLPLTITGYVRREAREKFFEGGKPQRKDFQKQRLTLETYKMCREEFAGGITHGNRFMIGETVEGCIRHRDFASHYPSQQICAYAPATKFALYYDYKWSSHTMTLKELSDMSKNYCLLVSIEIEDMILRKGITLPYAQTYKFMKNKRKGTEFVDDNGRVYSMNGSTIVTLNELDLRWVCKQYNFSYHVLKVYRASKGEFPKFIRDTVFKFFYGKTEWKCKEKETLNAGYSKESPEFLAVHLNLLLQKGMLNGIYGMSATDPVRLSYEEDEYGEWYHENLTDLLIKDKLDEFYNSYNSFMSYQLGVWTTSHARNELMEFVELVGYENFIYADTDSIFYLSTPEIEERIEAKNKEFRDIDDKKGWYIVCNDKKVYFNQFELEDEDILRFKFLHSKCYAYETNKDGKIDLNVVIAGVTSTNKEVDANKCVTRSEELGSLDELRHGKTFVQCGGSMISYVNRVPETINIDGHITEVASGAIIKKTTKTLHDSFVTAEIGIEWETIDGEDLF